MILKPTQAHNLKNLIGLCQGLRDVLALTLQAVQNIV